MPIPEGTFLIQRPLGPSNLPPKHLTTSGDWLNLCSLNHRIFKDRLGMGDLVSCFQFSNDLKLTAVDNDDMNSYLLAAYPAFSGLYTLSHVILPRGIILIVMLRKLKSREATSVTQDTQQISEQRVGRKLVLIWPSLSTAASVFLFVFFSFL